MTDYLLIFITVLAAIEVDRLIWDNIHQERFKKTIVIEIKIPMGADKSQVIDAIKKDIERMINEDDKHQ